MPLGWNVLNCVVAVFDSVLVKELTGDDQMCRQWDVLNPTIHTSLNDNFVVNDLLGWGVVERPALIGNLDEYLMARQVDRRIVAIDKLLP